MKILQSELQTREATEVEQEELDIRTTKINAGELKDNQLFDPEPGAKHENETPEEKKAREEEAAENKTEEQKKAKAEDVEILEADDDELNDDQKARKAELVKARELIEAQDNDDKLLEIDDKDLDEKQLARKQELAKAKGGKTDEEKKAELEAEIKEYATEHSMSEDDARKDLETIGKTVESYKGDSRKLAKSYLHAQRMAVKTKEELKALKNAPPPLQSKEATMKSLVDGIEAGKMPVNGKPAPKEDVIAAYRKMNPDIAGDEVSDDTIVRLVARDVSRDLADRRQENLSKLTGEAKEKKAKLISELSEADKKYLPTMKAMLDSNTDAQIMSEDYSLDDYIFWAKGKDSVAREKEIEERGFKRGAEARKILGEIKKPAEGKARTKSSVKGGKDFGLSADQKKEAEELFEGNNVPLSRKYELFAEVVDDEKKREEKKKKEK